MTTQTKTSLLTADDLLRLHGEGVRGELIRGVLCKSMAAGVDHGKYVMNLAVALGSFIKARRLGSLIGSDSGVWLGRDPDTVREPDIAFISSDRVSLGVSVPGYSEVVPDLVVEIASPSDSRRSVNDKARMWHSSGVRLVWAAYPDTRSVDVHLEDGSIMTLNENDALDGGDVLPGFTCPVSDMFEL